MMSEEFKESVVEESNDYETAALEWSMLKREMDARKHEREEGVKARMMRKIKQNPFVPIGALATTFCLTYGLYSMVRQDSKKQQLMMRGRVLAQAFTVVCIAGGIISTSMVKKE